MAIVRGGLFGLEAHGQYAKTLGYQRLRGKNIVSRYHKPGGKPSELQENSRYIGSMTKKLLNTSIQYGDEMPINWRASMREARIRNTLYGLALQQNWRFMPVLKNGEGVLVTKVCVVYSDHIVWDVLKGTTYRRILPSLTRFTYTVSTGQIGNWRLYGLSLNTGNAGVFNFTSNVKPVVGFKYAKFFVKTQSSEEFMIYPLCYDWSKTPSGRKGGSDSEEDDDEKKIDPEK